MTVGIGLRAKRQRTCQQCGRQFETTKATARYCSVPCRRAGDVYLRTAGKGAQRTAGKGAQTG